MLDATITRSGAVDREALAKTAPPGSGSLTDANQVGLGTVSEVVVGPPGPPGPPGPAGASNALYTGNWNYRTSGTATGAGQISTDQPTNWGVTTVVYLNEITSDSKDTTVYLDRIEVGDGLILQVQANSAVYEKYSVSALPTDQGNWRSIPVSIVESAGATPTNNTSMVLTLVKSGSGGSTIYSGTGVPPTTLGHLGDYYIKTNAPTAMYGPKQASGTIWPLALQGV